MISGARVLPGAFWREATPPNLGSPPVRHGNVDFSLRTNVPGSTCNASASGSADSGTSHSRQLSNVLFLCQRKPDGLAGVNRDAYGVAVFGFCQLRGLSLDDVRLRRSDNGWRALTRGHRWARWVRARWTGVVRTQEYGAYNDTSCHEEAGDDPADTHGLHRRDISAWGGSLEWVSSRTTRTTPSPLVAAISLDRHPQGLAASILLAQGIPLHEVSRYLGHSTISVTMDVYGHLAEDALRPAADVMGTALFEEPKTNERR